jgi:UDP-N-acetylglucosamine enolpyruvyl transferase
MISVKSDIQSIKKTLKALDSLGEKISRSAEREIERSARNIEAKAKRNVPTGVSNRLKTSIDVRGGGLSREVYTDVKYAPLYGVWY